MLLRFLWDEDREDLEANAWLRQIDDVHGVEDAILPDASRANVIHLDGLLNSVLLIELVKRAESGKPLLAGIEQLYVKERRELPR